uniref:Uncharacterized protein n=1 Tax=Parascaris univalens TaxID=6257 RepID=A0A915ANC9_PARUN
MNKYAFFVCSSSRHFQLGIITTAAMKLIGQLYPKIASCVIVHDDLSFSYNLYSPARSLTEFLLFQGIF